jgi:hypothetical protein
MGAGLRYQPLQSAVGVTHTRSAIAPEEAQKSNHYEPNPGSPGDYAVVGTVAPPPNPKVEYSNSGQTLETSMSEGLSNAPDKPTASRIVRMPVVSPPDYRFQLLQQWEGRVSDVSDQEFTAVLRDLTDPNQPEEEATFSLVEVSEQDEGLVARGAIFYWVIGYRISASGQKTRSSDLRFRRLPVWTRSEIKRFTKKAEEFEEVFGIGRSSSSSAG